MQTLILCVQQLQSDYQLFAANLLLQLDALVSFLTIGRQMLWHKLWQIRNFNI